MSYIPKKVSKINHGTTYRNDGVVFTHTSLLTVNEDELWNGQFVDNDAIDKIVEIMKTLNIYELNVKIFNMNR